MVNLVDIGCGSINIYTSTTQTEDIMKDKHTHGDLEAINNLVRSSMTTPDGMPKGILIAECNDSYGLPHSPEAMAYAKLFAAAPELLDEAKKQLDWLQHVMPQVQAPESVMMGFSQSIKAFKEVIEKAEGGAS